MVVLTKTSRNGLLERFPRSGRRTINDVPDPDSFPLDFSLIDFITLLRSCDLLNLNCFKIPQPIQGRSFVKDWYRKFNKEFF